MAPKEYAPKDPTSNPSALSKEGTVKACSRRVSSGSPAKGETKTNRTPHAGSAKRKHTHVEKRQKRSLGSSSEGTNRQSVERTSRFSKQTEPKQCAQPFVSAEPQRQVSGGCRNPHTRACNRKVFTLSTPSPSEGSHTSNTDNGVGLHRNRDPGRQGSSIAMGTSPSVTAT